MSADRQSTPSRLGRWLLRVRAGTDRRNEVESDLVELFHLRVRERGRRYAQWRWLLDAISVPRPDWPAPVPVSKDHPMTVFLQDLRTAIRALTAQPRFTTIAVVVLALGIGVTTAVFSVVNAVLLRPLPYPHPDRLVAVSGLYKSPTRVNPVRTIALASLPEWRSRATTLESIGAFAYTQLPVQIGNRAFAPTTALMDPEFLLTLGNRLAHGTFFPIDAPPGSDATAIISHSLWQDAFAGDPAAVGQPIRIDGEAYVVRGILAADFQFPRSDASYFTKPIELLMPASRLPGFPATSTQWWGIARLKPGVTPARAEAELQPIAEALSRNENTGAAMSVQLTPLAEETTRQARQPLLVLFGIAIVLLLVASANLMNLFFARGVGRLREMSIRRAIGSTTWRLVRLLLTESLVLAVLGGALGILLAAFAIKAVVLLSPVHLPVTGAIDIDGTVLLFTTLLCAGTALAAGLLPALHVSATTAEAVRHPGMRVSASRGAMRVQHGLCVAQIALGVALLTAAGLLANSLRELYAVDPGFEADQVIGFNVSVPGDIDLPARIRFYGAALDEIRALPGVERAGLISFLPPETRAGVVLSVAIDGIPPVPPGAPVRRANTLMTSADYFKTMRMPLVHGRDLTPLDDGAHPLVAVVNETFVRQYLPDGSPLGRRIGAAFGPAKPDREIVGVVRDSHDRGVAVAPMPTVYIPFQQRSLPYGAIAVRSQLPAETLVTAIRERLQRLNPAVPLTEFQTIDRRLAESLREPRFYTLLAMACAGMAVLFVTFGLYGLVSYSVGRRTTEIGIRMAIGAQRSTVIRMVLGQGVRMAAAGVAIGLAMAWMWTSALESLLYGVRPLDPPTFAAAAGCVLLVTLLAAYAPARRASRVNPMTALRQD